MIERTKDDNALLQEVLENFKRRAHIICTPSLFCRIEFYSLDLFLPQSKHFVRELGKHDGCKDEAAAEDFSGAHSLTKDKPAADEREG